VGGLRDKSRSLASATSSLLAWSLLFSQDLFGDVDLGLGDVDGIAGAMVVVVLGQDEGTVTRVIYGPSLLKAGPRPAAAGGKKKLSGGCG